MADGAKPKVMSSANESNSPQIGECASSARAAMPSKKSKTAPKIINKKAVAKSPSRACTVAIAPDKRFPHVNVLGIFFVMKLAIIMISILQ